VLDHARLRSSLIARSSIRLVTRDMATWRYSRYNSAEMALVNASGPTNHSDDQATADEAPEYFDDFNSEDLSYSDLDEFPIFLIERSKELRSLHLDHNQLVALPPELGAFNGLVSLDLSNNRLKVIADEICCLVHLRTFVARNNQLTAESVPKDFGLMPSLQLLNFSGNRLTDVPMQITELRELKCLYLGANQITTVPREICNLHRLVYILENCNPFKTVFAAVPNF